MHAIKNRILTGENLLTWFNRWTNDHSLDDRTVKYFQPNIVNWIGDFINLFSSEPPIKHSFQITPRKYDSSNTTLEMIYRFQYLFILINFDSKLQLSFSCKLLINFVYLLQLTLIHHLVLDKINFEVLTIEHVLQEETHKS